MPYSDSINARVLRGSLKAEGLGEGWTLAADRFPFTEQTIPKLRLRLPLGECRFLIHPQEQNDQRTVLHAISQGA